MHFLPTSWRFRSCEWLKCVHFSPALLPQNTLLWPSALEIATQPKIDSATVTRGSGERTMESIISRLGRVAKGSEQSRKKCADRQLGNSASPNGGAAIAKKIKTRRTTGMATRLLRIEGGEREKNKKIG